MHNSTKRRLEVFSSNNNWQMPHPLDMKRFYEFIIEAYNNGDTKILRENFSEIVESSSHKIGEDELDEWIILFENGIELLKVYNNKI